eukprot:COSAG02_NODE_39_length_48074_cov_106.508890_27_plen_81_part_00
MTAKGVPIATHERSPPCDGTELDQLDRPARYPQPRQGMSAALGPSPIASVRARWSYLPRLHRLPPHLPPATPPSRAHLQK